MFNEAAVHGNVGLIAQGTVHIAVDELRASAEHENVALASRVTTYAQLPSFNGDIMLIDTIEDAFERTSSGTALQFMIP